MTSMIVTYDLCGKGKNYEALYEKLKGYPRWAHITESSWFICTDEKCTSVRDALRRVMDTDDRLFVASLTGEAAWQNVLCNNDYLKSYL